MNRCQPCNKVFATSSSLKRHIHTKHPDGLDRSIEIRKKHCCSHCHLSFTRGESLRRHISSKHDRDLSLCSICMAQHRADYMVQHKSICAKRYLKWLQQHSDLDDIGGTATSRNGPRSLQLGSHVPRGHDTQRPKDDNPPRSQYKGRALHFVHEHIFDARLTGDALTCALMTFEETDNIDAYKQALIAAFCLNITFDSQNIRPLQESDRFSDLAEYALMIDEVNRDHLSINTMRSNGITIRAVQALQN
jgi:hypothetical protein